MSTWLGGLNWIRLVYINFKKVASGSETYSVNPVPKGDLTTLPKDWEILANKAAEALTKKIDATLIMKENGPCLSTIGPIKKEERIYEKATNDYGGKVDKVNVQEKSGVIETKL